MKKNGKNRLDAVTWEKLSTIKTAWEKAYEDEDKIKELPWVSTKLPTEILNNFVQIIRPCSDPNDKPLAILDFGCGTGRIGKKLVEQPGVDVYYYDVSSNALNYCLQQGIKKEFVIPDIEQCNRRFDGIIVWGVFHHIDPILWEYEMDLLLGLLNRNGHLLFCDFSDEDKLFETGRWRISEVTRLRTFPVNFNFIKSKINTEEEGYFDFEENKDFSSRKPEKRRMKYVIGELPLVERQRKIVRNWVELEEPPFWHFIEYSFDTSLTIPKGNAVHFFDDKNPLIANQLWLEGMSILYDFDKRGLLSSGKLFSTSLSNSLFLSANKRLSFHVQSVEGSNVSLSISKKTYNDFGLFELVLTAPAINFAFNHEDVPDPSKSFGVFIKAIREKVEKNPISTPITNTEFNILINKINSVGVLSPLTIPIMMMLLFVWPSQTYNRKSFVIIVPPVFEDEEGAGPIKEIAAGGVVMFSNHEISLHPLILSSIERWANLFTVERIVAYTRKQSVRSAIAQVMARNLSHNYGSHVLNHLLRAVMGTFLFKKDGPYKCKYQKPKDDKRETFQQIVCLIKVFDSDDSDIKDPNFKKLIDSIISKLKDIVEKIDDKKMGVMEMSELTNESLRQVVYLLNHIKCRVDYISDISFGAPMLHTSRRVYGDIFLELDRVSLLMNHISGLEENFKYQIEITGADNLQVAVPNDVVGTHAFYNILENIIRNTAKHASGQDNSEQTTTFHIDFSDIETKEEWADNIKEEAPYYYCVEIYDNIPMDAEAAEELVNIQNKRLNDPVFEGERPRSHSLGLVEMEASAAYLRKLDSSAVDDEQYHVINKLQNSELYEKYKDLYYNQYGQFNLLKAIMKPAGEGKYYFGYRFFMLRPQEVLIVGNRFTTLHKPKEGVWVVKKNIFEQDLNIGRVFNHEFVVYDGKDPEVKEHIENNKTALSPRVLEFDATQWLEKEDNSQTIIDECWNLWNKNNDKRWTLKFFRTGYDKDNNESTAVYKHHMEDADAKTDIEKNCIYAEAMSSAALEKLPNFSKVPPDKKGNRDIIKYKIGAFADTDTRTKPNYLTKTDYIRNRESVNNRILVIDERIQDAASKYNYGKGACVLPYAVFYDKMWVTVPKEDQINLAEKDFNKIKEDVKEYIGEELKKTPYDFMLIHYGILERIFKNDNDDWKEDMNQFLAGLPQNTRIVVTSGRGVPGGLPENIGFVSLSSVTSALIDYKSKYLINCLMYAARKTIK